MRLSAAHQTISAANGVSFIRVDGSRDVPGSCCLPVSGLSANRRNSVTCASPGALVRFGCTVGRTPTCGTNVIAGSASTSRSSVWSVKNSRESGDQMPSGAARSSYFAYTERMLEAPSPYALNSSPSVVACHSVPVRRSWNHRL